MQRDRLVSMLDAFDGISSKGDEYTMTDAISLTVLTQAGQGSAPPVDKVKSMRLGDAFVLLSCGETTYALPYENLMGLKVNSREQKTVARTGFQA
ncbi:MAG: hypothetical protein VX589_00315 [Myxococcota bacterium]|nr:hypothetical protein [Myxococcota bacterium]